MDTVCHNVPLENYGEAVLDEIRGEHDEAALREAHTEHEPELLGVAD